jgi:hypothetical protein
MSTGTTCGSVPSHCRSARVPLRGGGRASRKPRIFRHLPFSFGARPTSSEALAEAIEVRASTNDAIAVIDCRFAVLSRLQNSRCRDGVEAQSSDALHVPSNALEPAVGMREWRSKRPDTREAMLKSTNPY